MSAVTRRKDPGGGVRTEQEQILGLREVQKSLWNLYRVSLPIVLQLGDVVRLELRGAPRWSELVYAVGGYDGWIAGDLVEPEMSFQEAHRWAVAELRLEETRHP